MSGSSSGLVGLSAFCGSSFQSCHLASQTGFLSDGFRFGRICGCDDHLAQSCLLCAIWFAISLLGTAGLFLFEGAQFIGVATVAVYAGAIVVTFLFVLMLAQPEGLAFFDRMSWGTVPKIAGCDCCRWVHNCDC